MQWQAVLRSGDLIRSKGGGSTCLVSEYGYPQKSAGGGAG